MYDHSLFNDGLMYLEVSQFLVSYTQLQGLEEGVVEKGIY